MKGFVPQGFDVGSGEGLFGRDTDGSARTWTAEEVYDWLWPDGLDADTLEGHSASYFATATAIANMATASAVIADNVLVRGDGGARGIRATGVTVDDSNNISGVVGITATGKIATTLTTEQLRLAYDATHYAPFTVGSTGILTIAPNNAGAASYVSITGRLGVGTAAPAATIEVVSATGVTGLKGTSDTAYGMYGISTSSQGVRGASTSSHGVYGVSSSGVGVRGTSVTGYGSYFDSLGNHAIWGRQTGTLASSPSLAIIYLSRDFDGSSTYSSTGPIIHITDNPTNCTAVSGYLFTATIVSTERVRFNPRVADGASAVAYFWDTHNALSTAGAKIISFRNNGTEKAFVGYDGQGYFAGRIGAGTTAPGAVIEAALSTGVTGVKGTSDTLYGGYFISTSSYGSYSVSISNVAGRFQSTSNVGIYATSLSARAGAFAQTGTLTASTSQNVVSIDRTVDGSSSYAVSGNVISITDNPTNCTSISGYLLTASISGTERVRWNPRVADGASAVAYFIDSANALSTAGAKILSIRTNAVEKAYIGGGGQIYGAGAFGCNGATPRASATANALSAYATGAYGFDSDAHAQEIHTLLGQIRTALINNGIMVSA